LSIPAVVTAGDGSAAKAVYGHNKVFLELAGQPLVVRVVLVLQQVPEVSEVWVVGNPERLDAAFSPADVQAQLSKPLHIIPQLNHLWENCWEAYRRILVGDGVNGREPESEADLDVQPLYLSGDLPFATPEEISDFIRRGQQLDCDYAVGLVPEESLAPFLPVSPGQPGIEVAYFNLHEARLRQNNLHLCRPGRLGNRHYIEEMYQHRHQRQFGNMIALAWRLLSSRQGGVTILFFYVLMHAASVFDRWGWRTLADWIRSVVYLERTERAVSRLLGTRYRFLITEVGGCGIDIDTEQEFDAAKARFDEWMTVQRERAKKVPLPLAGGEGP
jgi:hypothetical protein